MWGRQARRTCSRASKRAHLSAHVSRREPVDEAQQALAQASTGSKASWKSSGVNGLQMKNIAPAPMAFSRVEFEVSELMKPKGIVMPASRSLPSNSRPVISGMFQSESTRSGGDPL